MIASVLLAAATALTPAELFWQRDLGGLSRTLQTQRTRDEQHRFFTEVVNLVSCEDLPPLENDASLERILLRVEAARAARLGAEATSLPTIWRDIFRPDFFRRATSDAEPPGPHLIWGESREEWPGEVLRLPRVVTQCPRAMNSVGELELVTAATVERAQASGRAELATRLAYHRALLLMRAGKRAEAQSLATRMQIDHLPTDAQPYARWLRTEANVDPATAPSPNDPEEVQLATLIQQVAAATKAANWREVVQLTDSVELAVSIDLSPEELTSVRYLLAQRAQALQHTGQSKEHGRLLTEVFPYSLDRDDSASEVARTLALDWMVEHPIRVDRLNPWLKGMGAHQVALWKSLGERALVRSRWPIVDAAIAGLRALPEPEAFAAAWELHGKRALARNQPQEFESATAQLLSREHRQKSKTHIQAMSDESTIILLQTLLSTRDRVAQARWSKIFAHTCEQARLSLAPSYQRRLMQLEQAAFQSRLSDEPAPSSLVVGSVRMARRNISLDPPTVTLHWPELYSLLSIPEKSGGWRDWFSAEATHIDVNRGHGGAQQ